MLQIMFCARINWCFSGLYNAYGLASRYFIVAADKSNIKLCCVSELFFIAAIGCMLLVVVWLDGLLLDCCYCCCSLKQYFSISSRKCKIPVYTRNSSSRAYPAIDAQEDEDAVRVPASTSL